MQRSHTRRSAVVRRRVDAVPRAAVRAGALRVARRARARPADARPRLPAGRSRNARAVAIVRLEVDQRRAALVRPAGVARSGAGARGAQRVAGATTPARAASCSGRSAGPFTSRRRASRVPQVHALLTQLAPVGQAALHPPQFAESFPVSTHALLQSVSAGPASAEHDVVHTPPAQTGVEPPSVAQTLLQLPQLFGSLWVAVQTLLQRCPPFRAEACSALAARAARAPDVASAAVVVVVLLVDARGTRTAPGQTHRRTCRPCTYHPRACDPQPPQFSGLLEVLTQTPPQYVSPAAGQVHLPATQLEPAPQTSPQPPQSLSSVCSFTQALAQSVVPVGQLRTHTPPDRPARRTRLVASAAVARVGREVDAHPVAERRRRPLRAGCTRCSRTPAPSRRRRRTRCSSWDRSRVDARSVAIDERRRAAEHARAGGADVTGRADVAARAAVVRIVGEIDARTVAQRRRGPLRARARSCDARFAHQRTRSRTFRSRRCCSGGSRTRRCSP